MRGPRRSRADRELYRIADGTLSLGEGARGVAGLYGVGLRPVLAQKLGQDVVPPLPVDEAITGPAAHLFVAGRALGPRARVVAREVSRLQLAQGQLRKCIRGAKLHELAPQALAPRRLVADHGSSGPKAVLPVDLDDARPAHERAHVLHGPKD